MCVRACVCVCVCVDCVARACGWGGGENEIWVDDWVGGVWVVLGCVGLGREGGEGEQAGLCARSM